jgi:hypothetical protein
VVDLADSKRACGLTHLEESRKSLVELYSGQQPSWGFLQVARSRNMLEPFDDLDFWSSLIGSAGLVAFLLRHEVIHIPMREGNFILILFAEELFLGKGGGGELGESVAQTSNPAVGKRASELGWSEWIVVSPRDFRGNGTRVFVA